MKSTTAVLAGLNEFASPVATCKEDIPYRPPLKKDANMTATPEQLKLLHSPFAESSISWRAGWQRIEGQAQALPYIDNRVIMNYLDDTVGASNWYNEYVEVVADGRLVAVRCVLLIRLETGWVGKSDAAPVMPNREGALDLAIKGAYSDAMKRAAVHWGLGRYLYGFRAPWVPVSERGRLLEIPCLPVEMLPAGAVPRAPAEAAKVAPVEAAKAAPVEAAKAAPVEAAKAAPVEVAKAAPVEVAKAAPVEAAKAAPVEVAKAAPVEAAKAAPVEVAKAAPVEVAKAAPVEVAQAAPVEVAKAAPVEVAQAAPVEVAKAAPVEVAKAAPVEVAQAAPVEVAKAAPARAATKTTQGDASKVVPSQAPAPADDLPEDLSQEQRTLVNDLLTRLAKMPVKMIRQYVEGPKGQEKLTPQSRGFLLKKITAHEAALSN